MSFWNPPAKPKTPLGYHRVLSPTASVKVSPIALGGISIGNSWGEVFGKNEDPFTLLDTYYSLGGNFIDTSSVYNSEDSEKLIGEWMEKRGVRDEMVIGTKYTAGYKSYMRDEKPGMFQSNYTGNSAKHMLVSIRDSLKKLRTEYIDILYVHWWDFATSVEEVMRHLHTFVMARQVLYLGVSDTPAWVVVKANAYARQHGLTPFSVYQGRWNAAYRDMEAEIIPMCEDQGMAIIPWAALGGGQLMTAEEREQKKNDPDARPDVYGGENEIKVCEALEKIATERETTLQAVALAYLFSQTPYVIPIVGVQTTQHINAIPSSLTIKLSDSEIKAIQTAATFTPQFPMNFLFGFRGEKDYYYHLGLVTARHNQQYQMSAWIDAPGRLGVYEPHTEYVEEDGGKEK